MPATLVGDGYRMNTSVVTCYTEAGALDEAHERPAAVLELSLARDTDLLEVYCALDPGHSDGARSALHAPAEPSSPRQA